MINLIQIGLSLGCVYALIALGFSVVYRTSGVLNLAQGGYVMVGGLVSAWAAGTLHLPLGVAMLAGVVAAAAAGLLLACGIVIPLWGRKATEFSVILGTLMFLFVLENVSLNVFGSKPLTLPAIADASISLPGASVSVQYVLLMAVTLLLLWASWRWLHRSDTGLAMQAVAESQMVSRILGISPRKIAVIAFTATAAFGGVGGVLITPIQYAAFNLGVIYTVKGFTAAVLGGFGSVGGALIGGLLVGLLEAFTARYVSSTYLDTIVLLTLFVALLFKSEGLLGSELK